MSEWYKLHFYIKYWILRAQNLYYFSFLFLPVKSAADKMPFPPDFEVAENKISVEL